MDCLCVFSGYYRSKCIGCFHDNLNDTILIKALNCLLLYCFSSGYLLSLGYLSKYVSIKHWLMLCFSICMGWTWINFQKFLTDLKFEFVMIKRDNASWFIIILGNRAFFKICYIFIPTNNNNNSYDDNNCKKQKKKSKC